MSEIFKIIGDLGFPVAAALAGGYFVYLTIKLLLAGVLSSIKGMAGIITSLDNRVKTMNHDVVRIDTIVSNAFWCQVLANHLESQVIAGFDQTDKGSGKHYNAAFYFTPYSEKISRYEKQILLPLAETLPWSFLKNITKRYGITEFFTPGSFSKLLGKDLQAGVSICIEETFPSIMRDARRRGARFFVNLTNDGWYPNTNLPMQHCSHSKIRAVENGVYLLRACNTGVTCFIDHKGRVLSQLPAQSWTGSPEKGALFQRVVLEVENTLYTYWGDVVIVGFCVVSLLIFLIGLGYRALFHIL